MRVDEESEKAGLKFNFQKSKIMASGPITLRKIGGVKVETMTDFLFLGSKITVDGDCRHAIKGLAPWKDRDGKPRQSIKKQRHHFTDNDQYIQSYGFCSSIVQV